MEDPEQKHQFSVRGLMILTTLMAVFLAVATRNYLAIKEEQKITFFPYSALSNYAFLWFLLCVAAIGLALFIKELKGVAGLYIFIAAAALLCLLNFLAPIGTL